MAQTRDSVVEDPQQIAVLASPARIEIMDTLEALGTAVSVSELAQHLGRAADGLYYHLRQLADAGLIEEDVGAEGRRYRTRTRAGNRLRLRYKPGKTPNARAVRSVAATIARVAERDFARALADPDTVAEGPRRALWAARGKGWVSADELLEINKLLNRLMDILLAPRTPQRTQLLALSWVLAPVDAKPARRGRARKTQAD